MPVDDPLAIERATALRLRQKSRSHLRQILICLLLAAVAAGIYVYHDARTISAAPAPLAAVQQPVRPTPPPSAPALNKDQTKISTGPETVPASSAVTPPQTTARQIEVGQRPVPPPPPAAGNDEEPITLTTAPLPIPRVP